MHKIRSRSASHARMSRVGADAFATVLSIAVRPPTLVSKAVCGRDALGESDAPRGYSYFLSILWTSAATSFISRPSGSHMFSFISWMVLHVAVRTG